MAAEGSGSLVAEKYLLLDKSKEIVHASTNFEEVKEKLSELTEFDDEITNREWEEIQQLNDKFLPHSVGEFKICKMKNYDESIWEIRPGRMSNLSFEKIKEVSQNKIKSFSESQGESKQFIKYLDIVLTEMLTEDEIDHLKRVLMHFMVVAARSVTVRLKLEDKIENIEMAIKIQ